MTSKFESLPGILRVTLTGDLIGGAEAMKFAVDLREELLAHPLPKTGGGSDGKVEIDAGAVGFVNSSGLGMLIAARQTALEHGADFQLTATGEQLKHLLKITKLSEIFGVN